MNMEISPKIAPRYNVIFLQKRKRKSGKNQNERRN